MDRCPTAIAASVLNELRIRAGRAPGPLDLITIYINKKAVSFRFRRARGTMVSVVMQLID